jgi:hypothetical protein
MARIAVAVIALTLAGVSLAAAPEPRAGTAGCQDAKTALADAKQKLKKAKKALKEAETPRAKEKAKNRLKKARDRLRDAEEAAAEACTGEVRFMVIGAQGKGNTGQAEVGAAMDTVCEESGCDYIIGLGNNIYDSGVTSTSDDQFMSKFETPYAGNDVKFWLGLGNHDYGGNGAGTEPAKAQVQIDYTDVSPSGKWKMPDHYYRRTDGPVEFFTLDTNPLMFGDDDDQETDISTWVANSDAEWKIALGLHGYRSNGPHGNAGDYDGTFIPPADGTNVKDFIEDNICGEADVYFSAHDHSLQWPEQDATNCPGTELIVSGTAAASTELEGDNPTHFESLELGFAYVVIEGSQMTVDFIDADGAVLFTRTITK